MHLVVIILDFRDWMDCMQVLAHFSILGCNGTRFIFETRKKVSVLEKLQLDKKTSLEYHSNLFSHLTFSWLTPIVQIASKVTLQSHHIFRLRKCDLTANVLSRYVSNKGLITVPSVTTVATLGERGHHIIWALARTIGGYALLQIGISIITVFLQFSGPFFINRLLKSFDLMPENPSSIDIGLPLSLIFGLFFCNVCSALLHGQQFFVGRRQSSHARSILMAEIYAKSLRRVAWSGQGRSGSGATVEGDSTDRKDGASTGKIISLLSVDVEKIREYLSYTYNLLVFFPVSLIISIASLSSIMGIVPTLCGLSVMLVMGPMNYIAGNWLKKAQEELSHATDKRITATNELLHGIRILKYLSWEDKFNANIEQLRSIELKHLYNLLLCQLLFNTTSMASGLLVSFIIFSIHSVQSETGGMDPATAFTGLYLVQQFMDILSRLPYDLMFFFQAKVAMGRILKFLSEEEVEGSCHDDLNRTISLEEARICFKNASYAFYGSSEQSLPAASFALTNLNIEFKINGLNVICGSTGSGKSSLCLALLGELKRVSGSICMHDGTTNHPVIAYGAQTAWLLNATIRDNILMGRAYDPDRYHHVLEAAALLKDMETLESGDKTEIGEKGVNVSGGQKQRISLARCLYSNASIVILDDPLSAVDAPTAKYLMTHAINGPLLRNRTVILVTHAVSLVLPSADFVVFMKGGEVLASGTPLEIAQNPEVHDVNEQMLGDLNESPRMKHTPRLSTSMSTDSQTPDKTLVQTEKMATGNVSLKVYGAYLAAAGGVFYGVTFLASFWVTILVQFGNDYWLKKWSEAGNVNSTYFSESQIDSMLISTISPWSSSISNAVASILTETDGHQAVKTVKSDTSTAYYIFIYGLFGFGIIIANNLNSFISITCAIRAATHLHKKLITAMLGAPLRFFEVTPIGRILNRFSKDISVVDQGVMTTVRFFLNRVFIGVSVIIVISSGSKYFLLAVVPIAMVSLHVGKMYLNASRALKRLESVSRSPIYNQFSETLNGVATIRAFRQCNRFLAQNNEKVDNNHRFFYTLWAGNRWLCIRTDLISATVVLCSGLTIVFGYSYITKGWAGIILLYAGKFSDALVWVVRMHAEMEMALDSVERVVEYSEVEQEPPRVNPNYRPPGNWPEQGNVKVTNLSIKYAADQPCVLKSLNFYVKAGEKVGVVGRTGAGKSTLSLAFFRIIPFHEGTIEIDNFDLSKMGLHDLRSRLTIIPQDPVLFEGTLRSNLNPFNEYSDKEIWQVLKATHVLDSLQQTTTAISPTGSDDTLTESPSLCSWQQQQQESSITLDTPVTENGANFSQGQRQLLCMARALLRNTRIVFLDEATASIDGPTDARIQNTIRERLWDRTIFCIAHRLKSVADYDRILVLDDGRVVEYASPFELIMQQDLSSSKPNEDRKSLITGQFHRMCQETGEFDEILELSKKAWNFKKGVE
ncbi:P-loop containing nucleoside triphosphate hydrolase protein [Obelidium mucronatum]|nr:P-loop containing nucleoside triphosphate hydrolase protein [Obelidium mucronatum]